MSLLCTIAKRVVPARVRAYLRAQYLFARFTGIVYEGDYPTWQAARAAARGYDAPSILRKSLRAALKVKRGEAAYERDSVTFQRPEYRYPLLVALLYAASARRGCLIVLDFGGGLGSSYFQHRYHLGMLRSLEWRMVEQPHFADCGNARLADKHLRFFQNLDDALAPGLPDVVLLSSVLPYLEAPLALVDRLAALRVPFLVIDRTIILRDRPTRLTVQRVSTQIYPAFYPCWILNEELLLERFAHAYELVDDFDAYEGTAVDLGDAKAFYKGYTLRLRAN